MTEKVNVVVIPEAKEDAYNMGYERFKGSDDAENPDLSYFKDSAAFANHTLPNLRAMSGYNDRGIGTFTENVKVVTVENPEDRPMQGQLTESHYVFEELTEMWDNGAYDALTGESRGKSLYL